MIFKKEIGKRKQLLFALGLSITLGTPLPISAANLQGVAGDEASAVSDQSIIGNKSILALEDVLKLALDKNPQLLSLIHI